MKSTSLLTLAFVLGFTGLGYAQVGIGTTTPNANAILDLESTSKGLKYPKVALTSTTAFAPLTAHVQGMTVYNTATINDVTPGVYVNDGTRWSRIGYTATSTPQTGGNVVLNPGESFFYIRQMPRANSHLLSEYFADVPVIDGLRMDVWDNDAVYYTPGLHNTTASPIKIHYTSIASVNYQVDGVNVTIPAAGPTGYVNVDDNFTVFGSNTAAETETVDVVIGTKWYRLFWFCYIDNATSGFRTIRMSITRLQ